MKLGDLLAHYKNVISSPKFRVISVALLSAITWFCWAYWANRTDPNQAMVSGLFQGGVNLFTTAFGSAALEVLYIRIGGSYLGKVFCVVIVSSFSLGLMLAAHLFAETPNILLTVLPVYIVVVLFCSSYIFGLNKIKKQYDRKQVVAQ